MVTVLAREEPTLLDYVPKAQRARALQATAARTLRAYRGAWSPPIPSNRDAEPHLGLFVLDGVLLRRFQLGGRDCVELLGAGDVIRPWPGVDDLVDASSSDSWEVDTEARIAVLDAGFAQRIAPYPGIHAALLDLALRRTRWLALHVGLGHLPRLQARLPLTLWYLADRWGRVTSDGVVLPLRLNHATLAALVGARRPAVTTCIGELASEGRVLRRADGSWLLRGEPPEAFAEVRASTV